MNGGHLLATHTFLLQGNGNLSNSFAQHPLAYFLSTGVLIAVALFVIFDSNTAIHESVSWAVFSSPVSITILAGLIGLILDSQLPVVIAGNDITVGTFTPGEAGRGIAIGIAAIAWLLLMSKWFTKRSARSRRRRVRRERPLLPETQARADLGSPYGIRQHRIGRNNRPRLPPRR